MMDTNTVAKKSEPIYTISELIDVLQVTRRTLLNYIKAKRIKAFKIGNEWRITQTHLDEFIEKNMR
jgi:excisionase family DNA binding protein